MIKIISKGTYHITKVLYNGEELKGVESVVIHPIDLADEPLKADITFNQVHLDLKAEIGNPGEVAKVILRT